MKIVLLDVQKPNAGVVLTEWFDAEEKKFLCPPLSLPVLASLTDNDVNIIDQKVEALDMLDSIDVELIGLTFKSYSLAEAQRLALQARERGITVAAGGIHASLVPDEVLEFVDAVIVGEGEMTWKRFIDDFHKGDIQQIYTTDQLAVLSEQPIPRFELLDNSKYYFHSIQTSRGCSLDCEFCPTKLMFGGVFRLKTVQQVMEEIRTVLDLEKKDIFFTDDIFGAGDRKFIDDLLSEIKKLGIRFVIISDFQILSKALIAKLADAGCMAMCLNMPGTCTPEEAKCVKVIQAAGIDVWGYFMFGFEQHDESVFERVVNFVKMTEMKALSVTVMAPFPGTPLFHKLKAEKRITTYDWNLYDQNQVVHTPAKMSAKELREGYTWARQELNDLIGFHNYSKLLQGG